MNYLMTKIVCVYNVNYEKELTLYKVYDAEIIEQRVYSIFKCDDGVGRNFIKGRFITLAEYREQQLNSILDGMD